MKYRDDIDGLRAVAVLAVIANHAFDGLLPSGYLGVDIFFVISGFVITQTLLSQKPTGFGSFVSSFFSRRVKRLMPAILVCVGLSSLVLVNLDPMPEQSLLTGAYSLFGMANISLYLQELDYFAPSIRYNTFMHTWSLGVEEQFYLFFPFIIWLLFHRHRSKSPQILGASIALLSLISLASFVYLYERAPSATYYLLPMRFWEIGTGAIVATITARLRTCSDSAFITKPGNQLLPLVLLLFLFGLFLFPRLYGAHVTVLAVAVTAALLMIGVNKSNQSFLLSNGVAKYIGRLSYSLYLWHWPLLTFAVLAPSTIFANKVVAFLLLSTLSVGSYHLVEMPLRYRTWRNQKSQEILLAAMASVLMFIGVMSVQKFPDIFRLPYLDGMRINKAALRPGSLPLPGSGLPFNPTCVVDAVKRPLRDRTFEDCTVPPQAGRSARTIWAMGDSHAGHLQGLLYRLRDLTGIGVHLVETPGQAVPSSTGVDFLPRKKLFESALAEMKPGDIVMLGRLYISRTKEMSVFSDVENWTTAVARLSTYLENLGVLVVLIGPPPMFQFEDIRSCDPYKIDSCSVSRNDVAPAIAKVQAQLDLVEKRHANVVVYHPFDKLCPVGNHFCSPLYDKVFLFRDRDHLNSYGAALLADDFISVMEMAGIIL